MPGLIVFLIILAFISIALSACKSLWCLEAHCLTPFHCTHPTLVSLALQCVSDLILHPAVSLVITLFLSWSG